VIVKRGQRGAIRDDQRAPCAATIETVIAPGAAIASG
jgi:hypothetical protein